MSELIARCGFWKGHKFGKWQETLREKLQYRGSQEIAGIMVMQERQCQDCGFKEINKQRVTV